MIKSETDTIKSSVDDTGEQKREANMYYQPVPNAAATGMHRTVRQ